MRYDVRIVVGVNGSDGSNVAIRYAAREAVRRNAALHLVHAVPECIEDNPAAYVLGSTPVAAAGRRILADAYDLARSLVAESRVSTELLPGPRADALVAVSGDADLLVLGDEHATYLAKRPDDWTIDGVVIRAHCAVGVVPTAWRTVREKGLVIAGVRQARRSLALIEAGLEEARRRRASLVLLHASYRPELDADALARGVDKELWLEEDRRILAEAAEPLLEDYPEVPIQIRAVVGRPAAVLRRAASAAGLLLVDRTLAEPAEPGQPLSAHFGHTGRQILRRPPCPVEVVPEPSPWLIPSPRRDSAQVTEARPVVSR